MFATEDCKGNVGKSESVYAKKSMVTQLLIREMLSGMKLNEGDNILSYTNAFENLVRQIGIAKANVEEPDLIVQLFLTLPGKLNPRVRALQNVQNGKLTFNMIKERLMTGDVRSKYHKFGHKARNCRQKNNICSHQKFCMFMTRGKRFLKWTQISRTCKNQ